jgi:hypothetical protein
MGKVALLPIQRHQNDQYEGTLFQQLASPHTSPTRKPSAILLAGTPHLLVFRAVLTPSANPDIR